MLSNCSDPILTAGDSYSIYTMYTHRMTPIDESNTRISSCIVSSICKMPNISDVLHPCATYLEANKYHKLSKARTSVAE